MEARFRSWWLYIGKHWVATIIIVFVGLIVIVVLGYLFKWDWTGFNSGTSQITITSPSNGNYNAAVSQPSKSLWDWLQLLAVLAIPVVVGLGAAWYTAQQGKVSDREHTDNQLEKALKEYIDKMSELFLHAGLLEDDPKKEVRETARIQTLTALNRLDGKRKGNVLQFLHDSQLINQDKAIIALKGANLRGADLSGVDLREADLSGPFQWREPDDPSNPNRPVSIRTIGIGDKIYGANLRGAKLINARLENANLKNAIMPDGSKHP